jgi:hypothetical protein
MADIIDHSTETSTEIVRTALDRLSFYEGWTPNRSATTFLEYASSGRLHDECGCTTRGIVELVRLEHRDQNAEKTVGEGAERTTVRVTERRKHSQPFVLAVARYVVLARIARPVVEGVPPTAVAASPHAHDPALAALAGHGCSATPECPRRHATVPLTSASTGALTTLPTPGRDRRISASRCSGFHPLVRWSGTGSGTSTLHAPNGRRRSSGGPSSAQLDEAARQVPSTEAGAGTEELRIGPESEAERRPFTRRTARGDPAGGSSSARLAEAARRVPSTEAGADWRPFTPTA